MIESQSVCVYCNGLVGTTGIVHNIECPLYYQSHIGWVIPVKPQYGWECPKCGSVWSPYIEKCKEC